MYEEYLENYNEYKHKFGKVAIFLMVGIFYEMYDVRNPETGESNTTFLELIDMLGLKVSVKKGEGPGGLDGLVAGIPDYTVHKWAGRLTSLGWTVVLIEQDKNAAGKVIRRSVKRILTPGSHVEAASSSDMFLTFVSLSNSSISAPTIATTAIDLTTGHLHVFETQAQGTADAWTSNDLVQFMELYPPKEVLWSVEGTSSFCDSITPVKLKSILGCQQATPFHKRSPLNTGAWLIPSHREEFLRKRCGLKSLLPTHVALHLAQGSKTESSLLSLLYALEELWPSMNLGNLLVYPWIPGSSLRLGENALVQLHMIVPQDTTKQDVLSLFDKCSSPMGHRGLRERLLKPSSSVKQITENLDKVEAWSKKPIEYRLEVVKRLRSMSDFHRVYRRIQQGSLTSTDLMGLDTSLKAAEWIFRQESQSIQDSLEIREELFKVFSADKIYSGSDETSLFVKGVNPNLDSLEDQIQAENENLQAWINERASSISLNPDIFKIEFKERSLAIKAPKAAIQALKSSGKLPPDCLAVVNKSYSYLESPSLDKTFAILFRLKENLQKEQSATLVEQGAILSALLFSQWMRLTDLLTQIDVNLTLARVALDLGYVRPILLDSSEGSVTLEGLRHPLLEAQDKKIPYVQHNVGIGLERQGWLLYGLNASGKSSLMRATGLAVLLAQGGSFVPASKMSLAPFQSLHTRIINTDNLWMGLSSFAVEMSEMRDIFLQADPRSLVLGDELCSGTETTSATALVAAGLKGLLKRGARFLFATHLHGLSQIDQVSKDSKLSIKHLHVEYDQLKDKLVYHRTLRDGPGSSLYGLEVAKAMRIPDDILEDAIRFRKQLTGETDRSLSVGSSWNSSVARIQCETCGSTEAAGLEVHHIKERHTAVKGRLEDGSDVHSAANLAVLCDTCHDSVHNGTLNIGPLTMTSEGPERSVSVVTTQERKSKWSVEEEQMIQSVCEKFKTASTGNLSKYLLNQHNIQISGSTLRRFRI